MKQEEPDRGTLTEESEKNSLHNRPGSENPDTSGIVFGEHFGGLD
jgi:hypothetical protein